MSLHGVMTGHTVSWVDYYACGVTTGHSMSQVDYHVFGVTVNVLYLHTCTSGMSHIRLSTVPTNTSCAHAAR